MSVAGEEEPKVSLCVDCARHPSLKRVISEMAVTGICAFCTRDDATVRDPAEVEPMVMLMRALVRFYWDEDAYNPHWGGESVMTLFEDAANPVVTPAVADTYLDDFDELLEWPPYPDWDKGISVYAGHDDVSRGLVFAISRTGSPAVRDLRERVATESFAAVGPELERLIDPFLNDIALILSKGTLGLRARTGFEKLFVRFENFESRLVRQPYMAAAIGASPTPGDGRLNQPGQPVLYLASSAYTALAEIRPHPGHYVSIGGFETLADLRLADFDPDIALFSSSDERLALYGIVQTFDRMLSTPVTPEDKGDYRLTQLLAEILKAKGFEGVRYRSSVSDGVNFCLLDAGAARFVDKLSEVRMVKNVTYDAPVSPSLTAPTIDDRELKR